MKILIWTGREPFQEEMVRKLKKEKHEVYLLYNERQGGVRHNRDAFEEYHLEYASAHVVTLLRNISPDVCLFLEDVTPVLQSDTAYVAYVSGLTNAVLCAKQAGVPRFYYRSSMAVFEQNPEPVIAPDTRPMRSYELGARIQQCEQICQLNQTPQFRAVILRCAEIYGEGVREEATDAVSRLLAGTADQPAPYRPEDHHALIYQKDACDAVYRVLLSETLPEDPVLIGPRQTVCEQELADLIQPQLPLCLQQQAGEPASQPHKFETRTLDALGYQAHYTLEQGLAQTCRGEHAIRRKEQRRELHSKRWVTFVETLAAFLLVQLFMWLTADFGFQAVMDIYLLFVLAIAVTYGMSQSVFAALLSIAGRTLLMNQLHGDAALLLEGVSYYYWCLQLVMLGTLTGFIKDKYRRRALDFEDEKEYMQDEIRYYRHLNQNSQQVKEIYEERLLNYQDSFAKIANIVSELDYLEPQKVFFESVAVLEKGMNSDHVCIYTVDPRTRFARLLASSGGKGAALPRSFFLGDYPQVLEVLQRGEVYINRAMEPQLPLFMKAIMDQGAITSIVMIYQIDFENLGLAQVNTFSVLVSLVEKSILRADQYFDGMRAERYYSGTGLMRWDPFCEMVELYCYGESKGLLDYTLMMLPNARARQDEVQRKIRATDYICRRDTDQGVRYYVLLTNTPRADAQHVIDRFAQIGVEAVCLDKRHGRQMREVYPALFGGKDEGDA